MVRLDVFKGESGPVLLLLVLLHQQNLHLEAQHLRFRLFWHDITEKVELHVILFIVTLPADFNIFLIETNLFIREVSQWNSYIDVVLSLSPLNGNSPNITHFTMPSDLKIYLRYF